MGAAITQRPDLFPRGVHRRARSRYGALLHFRTANNMPALLEYGDASKPEEFAAIRTYSRIRTCETASGIRR